MRLLAACALAATLALPVAAAEPAPNKALHALFEREQERPGHVGVELVLRPLHLYLDAPEGLECVVRIEQARVAEAECSPPLRAA